MQEKRTCCFFGHRCIFANIPTLYTEIERHITQYDVVTFYISRYGDFDEKSVDVLKELQQKYPHIEIIYVLAYLPGKSTEGYSPEWYSSSIYPAGLESVPQRFAITHRNCWIVEESDYVICYVELGYCGAYDAVRYAKKLGKQVVNLAD